MPCEEHRAILRPHFLKPSDQITTELLPRSYAEEHPEQSVDARRRRVFTTEVWMMHPAQSLHIQFGRTACQPRQFLTMVIDPAIVADSHLFR